VQVDEGWNEHNVVHVKLPGVGGHQDNIVQKVEKIRHWRTEMQLPPRAADLWRSAGSLQLYGDDEENEEVRTSSVCACGKMRSHRQPSLRFLFRGDTDWVMMALVAVWIHWNAAVAC
jgi:hypothetical protein